MRLVIAAAAAVGLCALFAGADAAAQNGSFRGSCRNVATLGGGFISAECDAGGGRWRVSTLNAGACIGDIGNQGGMLACEGAAATGGAFISQRKQDGGGYQDQGGRPSRGMGVAGSYQESCRRYGVVQGGYLTAECLSGGGRYRESTIQYTRCRSDISNQAGVLACEGAMATGGRYLNDARW